MSKQRKAERRRCSCGCDRGPKCLSIARFRVRRNAAGKTDFRDGSWSPAYATEMDVCSGCVFAGQDEVLTDYGREEMTLRELQK